MLCFILGFLRLRLESSLCWQEDVPFFQPMIHHHGCGMIKMAGGSLHHTRTQWIWSRACDDERNHWYQRENEGKIDVDIHPIGVIWTLHFGGFGGFCCGRCCAKASLEHHRWQPRDNCRRVVTSSESRGPPQFALFKEGLSENENKQNRKETLHGSGQPANIAVGCPFHFKNRIMFSPSSSSLRATELWHSKKERSLSRSWLMTWILTTSLAMPFSFKCSVYTSVSFNQFKNR